MDVRKSARLAAKQKGVHEETGNGGERSHRNGRRASVGDALGLTPKKTKGRNLQEAEAATKVAAAAPAAAPSG